MSVGVDHVEAVLDWMPIIKMGEFQWKPKIIEDVDGTKLVKFRSTDFELIRLIGGLAGLDLKELKSEKRMSLAGCDGFNALREARNMAQSAELQPSSAGLFADEAPEQPPPRKKARRSRPDEGKLLEVMLHSGASITMKRPLTSHQDLFVKLDSHSIEHAIMFIVNNGVSLEMLEASRQYSRKSAGETSAVPDGDAGGS